MPCYVLKCTECGLVEELILYTPDYRPVACRVCGAPLRQVYTGPPALRFRGSGFYATDYKKEEKTNDRD